MVIEALKERKVKVDDLEHLTSAEKESVKELLEFVSTKVKATTILHGEKARGEQTTDKSYVELLILADETTEEIKKSITNKTKEINKHNDFLLLAVAPFDKEFLNEFHSLREEILREGIIVIH
jgi:hypothetical protein